MLMIKFGKWIHKAKGSFIYDRIITRKGKETPFVKMRFRYVGKYPIADR